MLALLSNWKLITGGLLVAAIAGTVLYLRVQLNDTRAELASTQAQLIVAQAANESQLTAIEELVAANRKFEETIRANAEKLAQLERAAVEARDAAARTRAALEARRREDQVLPACAALRDLPLSVCPDLVRRLREREAAISPH